MTTSDGTGVPATANDMPHILAACFIFTNAKAKTTKTSKGQRPPKVEAVVRVTNLTLCADRGIEITLLNETTNEKQIVNTKIARAFGLPVFVHVPNETTVHWNKIVHSNHEVSWESAVDMCIKTANKATFFSRGNFYMVPSKVMSQLHSKTEWRPECFEHDLDKPKGMH